MDESILELGKRFLVSYLKGRSINYEVKHHWRKNWEFVVLHSLRVEGYVKKILEGENKELTQDEIVMTRLAAILHDVGRIWTKEKHAVLGREIVEQWIKDDRAAANAIKDSERLLYLIENHSNKESYEPDYCSKVLKDADILDEIGAMSIFMTSSWIDKDSPYYFNLIYDRVDSFEISFCDKGFNLLNTETAKSILAEKREFIINFNNQLKDELYGTEMFGQVSIEEFFK